ncbi:Uncharacterised protein [uncultured archaeon]|nr:Uncharacterised protein [uncultured archaeon]
MGKTDTIKQRSIYVYLPNEEMKTRWKEAALKRCTSVSDFIVQNIEDSLNSQQDDDYRSRAKLAEELERSKNELIIAEEKVRRQDILLQRYEEELREYRAKSFTEAGFRGSRKFNEELIKLLRTGRILAGDEIIARLGLKPTETEAIKAVSQQLEGLEGYGLIKLTRGGWQWTERQ